MKTSIVASKTNTENKFILNRVSEKKGSFFFSFQKEFSLITIDFTPIKLTVYDFTHPWNKMAFVVHLEISRRWESGLDETFF
uniref:Uncharacterized protein n=1 Tax=Lepeophtheirus salmonis TaxID=72036 RepID=A0A0K2SZS1_LEPSM